MSQRFTFVVLCLIFGFAAGCSGSSEQVRGASYQPAAESFSTFVDQTLLPAARTEGVSQKTLDQVRPLLTFLPRVIDLDQKQPEKMLSFKVYKAGILTPQRISQGVSLGKHHGAALDAVTRQTKIPREIILALWGIESGYGQNKGKIHVLSSLATLSFEGRRRDFFKDEFIAALKIVDAGHVSADQFLGSWAGAFGQCQFMPSSFLRFAVDGDGDGKIDLMSNPKDVFSSIANYLSLAGWQSQTKWAEEVALTSYKEVRATQDQGEKLLSEWEKVKGLKRLHPVKLPPSTPAKLILPLGFDSRGFLVYKNFSVLRQWNKSDNFALSVGLLADRIRAGLNAR